MISAWWLIPAFMIGMFAGVLIFCIVTAGGDDR